MNKKQDNWISVEDELPKEKGMYLVFNGSSITIEFYTDSYSGYSNNELSFTYWSYELSMQGKDGSVTHWQPLPQPPKE